MCLGCYSVPFTPSLGVEVRDSHFKEGGMAWGGGNRWCMEHPLALRPFPWERVEWWDNAGPVVSHWLLLPGRGGKNSSLYCFRGDGCPFLVGKRSGGGSGGVVLAAVMLPLIQ